MFIENFEKNLGKNLDSKFNLSFNKTFEKTPSSKFLSRDQSNDSLPDILKFATNSTVMSPKNKTKKKFETDNKQSKHEIKPLLNSKSKVTYPFESSGFSISTDPKFNQKNSNTPDIVIDIGSDLIQSNQANLSFSPIYTATKSIYQPIQPIQPIQPKSVKPIQPIQPIQPINLFKQFHQNPYLMDHYPPKKSVLNYLIVFLITQYIKYQLQMKNTIFRMTLIILILILIIQIVVIIQIIPRFQVIQMKCQY